MNRSRALAAVLWLYVIGALAAYLCQYGPLIERLARLVALG